MEQMTIFENMEEQERKEAQAKMFREWMTMPAEKLVLAVSSERMDVRSDLAHGYCMRWSKALHRCPGLPDDQYIWLNEIEPPEYWVLNRNGDQCGEHVETCPFCGADLKHGGGDVVLHKADDGWWRIQGFIKEDEEYVRS